MIYNYEDLVKDCKDITNPSDASYKRRIRNVQSVFAQDVLKAKREEAEIKNGKKMLLSNIGKQKT